MSRENVEAFKRGVEAYNRADIDALLEMHDPEVEWHPVMQVLLGGDPKAYRGHAGVREWVHDLAASFDDIHIELSEVRDLGDRVLAIGRLSGRGKASGVETEITLAWLAEFTRGRATRVLSFLEPSEAFEAAGLSSSP